MLEDADVAADDDVSDTQPPNGLRAEELNNPLPLVTLPVEAVLYEFIAFPFPPRVNDLFF